MSRQPAPPQHDGSGGDGELLTDWREDPWDASLGVGQVEALRRPGRVGRWIGYGAIALVMALIVAGGFYGWWYIRQANPPGAAGPVVQFVVTEDDTLHTISERLEADGIISNAGFFRSYVNDNGGLDVEPGLYLLPPNDHVGNTMRRLNTSPSETTTRITFPEGFTLQQMAARLAADETLPQFDAERFMQHANDPTIASAFRRPGVESLEGLLFPATYEVSNADNERQIIERMVAEMERVGAQMNIASPTPEIARYAPYEILIIASMIEREARTAQDRPQIARVIYNRLEAGMRLQIDATVLYETQPATLEPGDINRLIGVDNAWNTYTRDGLPATPIANPGRASIEAALNPAPRITPGDGRCSGVPADQCALYFYVIADAQGNHAFAVTAEQHQANVEAAREAGLITPAPPTPDPQPDDEDADADADGADADADA